MEDDKQSNELEVVADTTRRRNKIAEKYLDGVTNQSQLAIMFGVSQPTIHRDLNFLRDLWHKEKPKSRVARRDVSVRQLYNAAQKAMTAFERSKQNTEEFTFSTRKDICSKCRGYGTRDKIPCKNCGGSGRVEVEEMKKRIVGQAGNVAFLSEFRKCIESIAKLEGLYKENRGRPGKKDSFLVGEITSAEFEDNVTQEQILEALSEFKKMGQKKGIENDVIDAKSIPE